MSCIAGLLRRDGVPVDPRLIERMLAQMEGRAPDGTQVHCKGPVGFGHSLLRTDPSAAAGPYPLAGDGQTWVTADARIDARAELIAKLRRSGQMVTQDETAAGLIIHAWRAFGPALTEHLIGDYAFALWDQRTASLLCVRDHFGVRPFHYVQSAGFFAFASCPSALLVLPQLSAELDEVSVADFLLFGTLQDPQRSIYRDIACLRPAFALGVTKEGVSQRRYWTLPVDAEIRFPKRSEYVEAFAQLLEQAVVDRLPQGPVAVQLSGGMDSSSIAAIAAKRSRDSGHCLLAVNSTCKSVIPQDEEGELAQAIAAELRIPLFQQDMGAYGLFDRALDPALDTAVPTSYPKLAAYDDSLHRVAASGARVLLSGHGGDAVLAPSPGVIPRLLGSRQLAKLPGEIIHHLRHARRTTGLGLRTIFGRKPAAAAWSPEFPDWIDSAFAARVDLPARWKQGWDTYHGGAEARYQLQTPWLCRYFETAEALNRPVILRHPFYDLRLVTFSLGLPQFMLAHKTVLREAMRGKLPAAVLARPKTGLAGDVVGIQITKGKLAASPAMPEAGSFPAPLRRDRYLHTLGKYRESGGGASTWSNVSVLAPLAFRIWISNRQQGVVK